MVAKKFDNIVINVLLPVGGFPPPIKPMSVKTAKNTNIGNEAVKVIIVGTGKTIKFAIMEYVPSHTTIEIKIINLVLRNSLTLKTIESRVDSIKINACRNLFNLI
jgi:hypothetical protein